MDPASIFIIVIVAVVVVAFAALLFLTSAGLEAREGRRGQRRQPRPQHTRAENEQHSVSSPVRSRPARQSEHGRAGREAS